MPKYLRPHRRIWTRAHGPIPKGFYVDHINGNRRDNRLENLRLVTLTQNAWNSSIQKRNSSGEKNVTWDKWSRVWRVKIHIKGFRIVAPASSKPSAILAARLIRRTIQGEFRCDITGRNTTPSHTDLPPPSNRKYWPRKTSSK